MFNLNYPSNVLATVSVFLFIFNADMVDPDMFLDVFNLDYTYDELYMKEYAAKDQFFIKNFRNFGFETYSALLNLGGFFVFLIFYFAQIVLSKFVRGLVLFLHNLRQKEKKLYESRGLPVPKSKVFKWVLKKMGRF